MGKVVMIHGSNDLTVEAAAGYLGIAEQTLRNKIAAGNGPRRYKRFGRLFFKVQDLDAWVRQETEIKEAYSV